MLGPGVLAGSLQTGAEFFKPDIAMLAYVLIVSNINNQAVLFFDCRISAALVVLAPVADPPILPLDLEVAFHKELGRER